MADGVGIQRVKNNPFLTISSALIAAGKQTRDLLMQRADGMARGLAGKDQVESAEDAIDELADLTQGTFSGVIEASAQANILKAGASVGSELQDTGTPARPVKASYSSSSDSGASDDATRALFGDDDDDFLVRGSRSSGAQTPPRFSSSRSSTPVFTEKPTFKSLAERIASIVQGSPRLKRLRFVPLVLKEGYWSETGPDHLFTKTQTSVQYLAPSERQQYRVLPNTLPKNFSGIFVIGPDGELYIGKPRDGHFHHSSFFAGGVLTWAGEIRTNATGQIVELTDESGHYQPSKIHNLQGLDVLRQLGFDLSNAMFTEPFRAGCGFTGIERSMPVDQYFEYTHALLAQSAPTAQAAASQPIQNETEQ